MYRCSSAERRSVTVGRLLVVIVEGASLSMGDDGMCAPSVAILLNMRSWRLLQYDLIPYGGNQFPVYL